MNAEYTDAEIAAYLKRCAEAAVCTGSDFNQGVVRGLEIAAAQFEHGHYRAHASAGEAGTATDKREELSMEQDASKALIERARDTAYRWRQDGRGFDAKLIEALLDEIARIPLAIAAEHERRMQEYEAAGLCWRNPAPNAAAPMVPTSRSVKIDATGITPKVSP